MIGLLLARELTMVLRRSGFHILVTMQAIVGLALVFAAQVIVRQYTPGTPPSLGTAVTSTPTAPPPPSLLASSVDTTLLLGWALWLVVACVLIVPALTGGAIARERERGTLSVVLGSGASPAALVAAKLVGALLLMAGLVASGLPALGLALVFGAPPLQAVVASGLVVLAWGGVVAGVGLAASALTRSSSAGTAGALLAAVTLLALTVVAPAVAPALGVTPPALAFRLNPFMAVLLAEPETGRRIAEQLSAGQWVAAFTRDPSPPGPAWWPFVIASMAVCALLGGATSLIVGRSSSDV